MTYVVSFALVATVVVILATIAQLRRPAAQDVWGGRDPAWARERLRRQPVHVAEQKICTHQRAGDDGAGPRGGQPGERTKE